MKIKWNLDDIVSIEDFDGLFNSAENSLSRFDYFYRSMKPSMSKAEFSRFIDFSEELTRKLQLLYWRAALEEAADTASERARMLKNRVIDLELKAENSSRRIWHWIKGKNSGRKKTLDQQNAKRLFSACPDMSGYLLHKRELAAYTLVEREEMIISHKDVFGVEALTDIRTLLETGFEYVFRPEGRRARRIRTQSELSRYAHSPDSSERKAAYMALFERYRENTDKFFCIYRSVVRNWGFEASIRGYSSPVQMRNMDNRVPDGAVESLLEACRANRPVFQDYFRTKASALGTGRLSRYDIYAPVSEHENIIPFEKAASTVLETFREFSPGFYERAGRVMDMKHIDTHPYPGKQGGAFCATPGPDTVPYVMLNYTGTSRDMLTLAHELGHAVHSLYASGLPPSVQHAGLPMAETASTLGEMLVFDRLYLQARDDSLRRSLLFKKLQETYATVLRQAYFVEFELKAHSRIPEGITPDELSDIYFETLTEQFGNSVEVSGVFRSEWAYIPHIVNTPFYCYAYCFGELLSLSLYAEYRERGPSFVPVIEQILASGGGADPVVILRDAGFDITRPDFWDRGFAIIRGLQSELERLS